MNTITKRDLIEQNIDKVFPEGIVPEPVETTTLTEIALRPTGITTVELEAAKALAMAGPIIPEFMRGNPGAMLAAMQIAKRFSKYDPKTNSWISFDPIAVASCMYLVESSKGQSIGYTSAFVAAVIDGFAPIASRMRFTYEGEGEARRCTASAFLKGDPEAFTITTPELRLITPKKSPLWASNPDQQLAYYARRNWGRLYSPAVLLGIYDVEELDGDARQYRGPDNAKDVSEGAAALHRRMAEQAASRGDDKPEGFDAENVSKGLENDPSQSLREAQGRDLSPESVSATPKGKKRTEKRPPAVAKGAKTTRTLTNPKRMPSKEVVRRVADRAERGQKPPMPTNLKSYRAHVIWWLASYETEQEIEQHWRGEMKLRNACGIIEEERLGVRVLVDQRILEVRK